MVLLIAITSTDHWLPCKVVVPSLLHPCLDLAGDPLVGITGILLVFRFISSLFLFFYFAQIKYK
jgi:hypothetical protein